jgi:hypothetical protein
MWRSVNLAWDLSVNLALVLFLADLSSAVLNFVAFLQSGTGGQSTGITV